MKDTELAYLAGIVDGEGHIGLARHIKKTKVPGKLYFSHVPRVIVGFVERPETANLLQVFKGEFGGLLYPKKPSRFLGRKSLNSQLVYEVRNESALRLLRAIRPFLRLKAQQADILLTFTKQKNGRVPIAPGELNRREEMCLAIQGLNGNKRLLAA